MTNSDYQTAILKIVDKVDQIVTFTPAIKTVFTRYFDQLCKLAEDYGQAQQPYSKKLEKAQKRIKKFTPEQFEKYKRPDGTKAVPLFDICPPPKGYVKMNHWDNRCINVPTEIIYRPAESVNPLLWFGIFGDVDTNKQRKPSKDEKLMCDYVRIALIHDYKSRKPADRYIFSVNYKGKWFEWNRFREVVWGYYYPYPIQGITYHSATPQDKLSQLNRALNHVKADIKKLVTTPDSGDNAGDDKKQLWEDTNLGYMYLSKAVVQFADNKGALSTWSKRVKHDQTSNIRYMTKGQRCKVHIGDFRNYIQTKHPEIEMAGEIADEFMANLEARKATERHRRKK